VRNLPRALSLIADVCGIIFALVYIVFVTMLLVIDFGNRTLGIFLIAVSAVYIIFSLVNIFILEGRKSQKIIKRIYRYTKYAMRLINMVFVIASLVAMPFGTGQIVAVISVIVLLVSFVLSIIIDITVIVIKSVIKAAIKDIKQEFAEFAAAPDNTRLLN